MKFITVEPLRTGGELLYITEGATRVKPGDIVEANIYSTPRYHRVLKVGTTRKAAGSTYRGAVKTIERVVEGRELKAVERLLRAEEAYDKASAARDKASAALNREQARARTAQLMQSAPQLESLLRSAVMIELEEAIDLHPLLEGESFPEAVGRVTAT